MNLSDLFFVWSKVTKESGFFFKIKNLDFIREISKLE